MNSGPTTSESTDTLADRRELVSRLSSSDLYRDYVRAFQTLTGLPLTLRAAGAFQAPQQGSKSINAFCAALATRNKTCAACLQLQERLECSAATGPATLECFAGMSESAVPVRLGEHVIAYLQTGQVLFEAPGRVQFRRIVDRVSEIDRESPVAALEAEFRSTRIVGKSQYETILRLLEIFGQHLSALANQLMLQQTHAEPPVVARARAFISEHFQEAITLRQVARAVGMSPFYFCKTFKKGTDLTFTEYLSRVRVEAVKQILLDPHKRVSEAAYEAGFQSLSQFNRVFQRIVGETPSVFREQLHSGGTRQRTPQALVFAA